MAKTLSYWLLNACIFFFYLLRCFALIDSSTLEQTREETETEKMTHLESLVELGLSSTFSTILTQCSLDLFKVNISPVWFWCFYSLLCAQFFLYTPKVMSYCFPQVALEKVFNFATTNIFETRVSGRMVADMCRAAAKVRLDTSEQDFCCFCSLRVDFF